MTYFADLNTKDINEVNGGSIATTLATLLIASTGPVPYWLYR
ncbi:hypothetical protein [Ruminococcus sp.]|jgi:hypothetical protein|nr:hypothetical protein [Ruminococcus sp.]